MTCMELCGSVHIAQRQIPTQIPIGFIGLGRRVFIGHCRCKHTIILLRQNNRR